MSDQIPHIKALKSPILKYNYIERIKYYYSEYNYGELLTDINVKFICFECFINISIFITCLNMKDKKGKVQLFEFNEKTEAFKELEVRDYTPLYEYLDPNLIILIVDSLNYNKWLWSGRKTSWRSREIAKDMASYVSGKFFQYVFQDYEPQALKEILGLLFEDDLKYQDYDMMPDILDKEFKKIDSLMRERTVNELEIDRKYLPEIFSEDLLNLSYDNLSIMSMFVMEEFRKRGITCETTKDKIKFFRAVEYLKKELNTIIKSSQILRERRNI